MKIYKKKKKKSSDFSFIKGWKNSLITNSEIECEQFECDQLDCRIWTLYHCHHVPEVEARVDLGSNTPSSIKALCV